MVKTSTHFVHVDRAPHLDIFVQEKIEELVSSFKNNGRYHLEIWVSKVRAESKLRGPRFRCEAYLKMDGKSAAITIKKKSDSFYTAVEEVGLSLRNVLTKRSRCKARHGHRQGERHDQYDLCESERAELLAG